MATAAILRRIAPVAYALAVVVALLLMPPGPGEAAGPWQAQIVDAETGQPLEGVVVLFSWLKMTRTFGGPSPQFHDAEEVVTGSDGRFTIAARRHFVWNPLQYIDGPYVVIFKPGYGEGRIRAGVPPEWEKDEEKKHASTGEVLALGGVVLELFPLKTREERLKFYRSFQDGGVPPEYSKRLDEARRIERRRLGFRD